jgi:hypothetical protein
VICIGYEWERFQEVVDTAAKYAIPAELAIEIVFARAYGAKDQERVLIRQTRKAS